MVEIEILKNEQELAQKMIEMMDKIAKTDDLIEISDVGFICLHIAKQLVEIMDEKSKENAQIKSTCNFSMNVVTSFILSLFGSMLNLKNDKKQNNNKVDA